MKHLFTLSVLFIIVCESTTAQEFGKGERKFEQGKYYEAIQWYRHATYGLNKSHIAEAYWKIGECYRLTGNKLLAIGAYQEAIKAQCEKSSDAKKYISQFQNELATDTLNGKGEVYYCIKPAKQKDYESILSHFLSGIEIKNAIDNNDTIFVTINKLKAKIQVNLGSYERHYLISWIYSEYSDKISYLISAGGVEYINLYDEKKKMICFGYHPSYSSYGTTSNEWCMTVQKK